MNQIVEIVDFVHPKITSYQYAQLLKYCAKLPQGGHILRFSTVRQRSISALTDFESKWLK